MQKPKNAMAQWGGFEKVDLSRISATPSGGLSHLAYEKQRAFPAQCWVAVTWIVKPVDVFEDRHLSLSANVPSVPPYQLCLDGFEEGFKGGVLHL